MNLRGESHTERNVTTLPIGLLITNFRAIKIPHEYYNEEEALVLVAMNYE